MASNEDQIVPALLHQLENTNILKTSEGQPKDDDNQQGTASDMADEKKITMPFLRRKSQNLRIPKERIDWSLVPPRVNTRFDAPQLGTSRFDVTRRLSTPTVRESAFVAACYRQKVKLGEIQISIGRDPPRLDPKNIERKRVVPRTEEINHYENPQRWMKSSTKSLLTGRASAPGRFSSAKKK